MRAAKLLKRSRGIFDLNFRESFIPRCPAGRLSVITLSRIIYKVALLIRPAGTKDWKAI